MQVYFAQINPTIGRIAGNTEKILHQLALARGAGAEVVIFPELAITAYPPEDLLLDMTMIQAADDALTKIQPATRGLFVVVGVPRINPSGIERPLHNSAAIFADGELLGFRDKVLLPTYDVFDERRFFEPGAESQPTWSYMGKRIAVTICEDCWDGAYHCDPVAAIGSQQPDLFINISASPYFFGRHRMRLKVFSAIAQKLQCPVLFCNQVGANDQLIFDGSSFCLNGKGELIHQMGSFHEEGSLIDTMIGAPILPKEEDISHIYEALVLGVRDYFHKQGFSKALLGLSGGVDSALTACIAAEALGKENLSLFYLPTHISSPISERDAKRLALNLGIPLEIVSIQPLFESALREFKLPPKGLAVENLQARLRAIFLMSRSNETGALLLNTSNKSEMAMGFSTIYGDLCGSLGVLLDVLKTRVYGLARHLGPLIPPPILERVPTAELRENQTDQDTLPPYPLLDTVLEEYIEQQTPPIQIAKRHKIPLDLVHDIIHKVHLAEYKRRQAPIGLRVSQKSFSKGRVVPIVQSWK